MEHVEVYEEDKKRSGGELSSPRSQALLRCVLSPSTRPRLFISSLLLLHPLPSLLGPGRPRARTFPCSLHRLLYKAAPRGAGSGRSLSLCSRVLIMRPVGRRSEPRQCALVAATGASNPHVLVCSGCRRALANDTH